MYKTVNKKITGKTAQVKGKKKKKKFNFFFIFFLILFLFICYILFVGNRSEDRRNWSLRTLDEIGHYEL